MRQFCTLHAAALSKPMPRASRPHDVRSGRRTAIGTSQPDLSDGLDLGQVAASGLDSAEMVTAHSLRARDSVPLTGGAPQWMTNNGTSRARPQNACRACLWISNNLRITPDQWGFLS